MRFAAILIFNFCIPAIRYLSNFKFTKLNIFLIILFIALIPIFAYIWLNIEHFI